MALPFLFFNVTQATGAQLDANFAALGVLTPIPGTAAGTNTIVITPAANTPAISAYSTGMQFTGIAAATNTGASTGKIGSLATLPIYKASVAGPVPLTGGEIISGTSFTLLYDAALNSGAGGFHLLSAPIVSAAGGTISGLLLGTGTAASISFPTASFTRVAISGPTISRILTTTASIAFSAINPQLSAETSILLAGCSVGDNVMLGYPSSVASAIAYRGYINNAGTVALVAQNYSAGTVTPTPGTYRVTVMGF